METSSGCSIKSEIGFLKLVSIFQEFYFYQKYLDLNIFCYLIGIEQRMKMKTRFIVVQLYGQMYTVVNLGSLK